MDRIPSPTSPLYEGMREPPREGGLRPEVDSDIGFDTRAAELRVDPERLRLRSGNANVDPFNIDDIAKKYAPTGGRGTPEQIAKEIDFNFKRYEIYGKADYAEQRGYYDQGWRPVMHSHFPGRFAPAGTEGPVIIKDMLLMERPMILTVQARNEEMLAATRALQMNRQRMAETPEGQAPRMAPVVRTSREAIEIPE